MKVIRERRFRFAPGLVLVILLSSAPIWVDISIVSLMTKILIFGLAAMSLDIVFGYVGLWSFCHAALFAVAAYTNGILIQLFGITSFWVVAPLSILAAAVVSGIFAWIALRMSGIYFLLTTLALGQLIYSTAFVWRKVTGGSQGLYNIPYPDIGIGVEFSSVGYFYFTLAIVLICGIILHLFLKSPFGYSLRGIRENETRMIALGFNTWRHKWIAFVISGAFAGIAGILYLHYNGIVIPSTAEMSASGLMVIMVLIGGAGTFWGAMIGSAVIFILSHFVSLFTPERWPLVLGACFVAAVLFARGGIYPRLAGIWARIAHTPQERTGLGAEKVGSS